MFDMDEFIFSAKKNSKYPSLKIFLQPSCRFVKMYEPLRFFTFHPFSSAFIINMHFCIDLSDMFDEIEGISIYRKNRVIYILPVQTVYKSYTRGTIKDSLEFIKESLESTTDSLESTRESDKVKTNAQSGTISCG